MRIRASISALAGVLALVAAGCSSGGGEPAATPDDGDTTPSTAVDVDTELRPVVQPHTEIEALDGGPGDAQVRILGGAEVDGAAVVVVARNDDQYRPLGSTLLRSTDGRTWTEVPAPGGDLSLAGAATTSTGAVVVGTDRSTRTPVALRLTGDEDVALVELALPPAPERSEPFHPDAVGASGDDVLALASGVQVPEAGSDVIGTLAASTSAEGGATWDPVALPEGLATHPGGPPTVSAVLDDEHAWITVTTIGDGGIATSLWRSADRGATWTQLGTDGELLDGDSLTLLHHHDGEVLAFTTTGGDARLWRSADDGASFEPVDVPPALFSGAGNQRVDTATTLADGTLVAMGRTSGDYEGEMLSEVELWVSADLDAWHRAVDDIALQPDGIDEARTLIEVGDAVIAVGTTQRLENDDERAARQEGQPGGPPPAAARDGKTWVIELREEPVEDAPVTVELADVEGFEVGDEVNGVIEHDGGFLAIGKRTVDDDSRAAAWRSRDGAAWIRIDSGHLDQPGSAIESAAVVDGTIVAVGWRMTDERGAIPQLWTSTDGVNWNRTNLSSPEPPTSAYRVLSADDGVAMALGDVTDYTTEHVTRRPILWRSDDGATSWQEVPLGEGTVGAYDLEILSALAADADGDLLAGGFRSDVEMMESGGYRYGPQPWLMRSSDSGATWEEITGLDDGRYGMIQDIVATDGRALVLGGWNDGPHADENLATAPPMLGVGRIEGTDLVTDARIARHPHTLVAAVQSPAGTLAVGDVRRRVAGTDAAMMLVQGDEVRVLEGPLLGADGDQSATAALDLGGGEILVFGSDAREDGSHVLAWTVQAAD